MCEKVFVFYCWFPFVFHPMPLVELGLYAISESLWLSDGDHALILAVCVQVRLNYSANHCSYCLHNRGRKYLQ